MIQKVDCPTCDGTGGVDLGAPYHETEWGECGDCDGTGEVATKSGLLEQAVASLRQAREDVAEARLLYGTNDDRHELWNIDQDIRRMIPKLEGLLPESAAND